MRLHDQGFELADHFDTTAGLLRQSLLVGFPNVPLAFNFTGVPPTRTGRLLLPGFDVGSDTF